MRYGYARCSTNENRQDIQRQLRELKAAGADAVIWEYEHGDAIHKAELNALLQERAKAGDTIIATEISRLSRSTKQLCEIIDRVKEKRLRLVILGSITIDCTQGQLDPMTVAFLQMAGIFAELELQLIRARVKSGIANAKAKGKHTGRPVMSKDNLPALFLKYAPLYHQGQLTKKALAKLCGVSYPTIFKYITIAGIADKI